MYDGNPSKFILNGVLALEPHYRPLTTRYSNLEFRDTLILTEYAFVGNFGTAMDSLSATNISITNCSTVYHFLAFEFFKDVHFSNFTFQDVYETDSLMHWNLNVKITMTDLNMINYSSRQIRNQNDIEISNTPESEIYISGIYMSNCVLKTLPFMEIPSALVAFEFLNGVYEDVIIDGDTSFIDFKNVTSFLITNHSFTNVQIPENSEPGNYFVEFQSLSVEESDSLLFSDITIENSDISLFDFQSVSADDTLKTFTVRNLEILN